MGRYIRTDGAVIGAVGRYTETKIKYLMNYYNPHPPTSDNDGIRTRSHYVRAFRNDWYRNLFDDAIRIQSARASGGRQVYRNRSICPYLYGYVWTRNAGAVE